MFHVVCSYYCVFSRNLPVFQEVSNVDSHIFIWIWEEPQYISSKVCKTDIVTRFSTSVFFIHQKASPRPLVEVPLNDFVFFGNFAWSNSNLKSTRYLRGGRPQKYAKKNFIGPGEAV